MTVNNDFFKKLLDNLYDAVYFVDRDRRITYWNRGAEMLTGYKGSEVVGTYCRDNILMHVDDEGNNLCVSKSCPAVKAMSRCWCQVLTIDKYIFSHLISKQQTERFDFR